MVVTEDIPLMRRHDDHVVSTCEWDRLANGTFRQA
jgi:hypothetical protein